LLVIFKSFCHTMLASSAALRPVYSDTTQLNCDVYVGGKVRVSEFMIFLDLQHCGSK